MPFFVYGGVLLGLHLPALAGSGDARLGLLLSNLVGSGGVRFGLRLPGGGSSGSSFENTSTFCPFGVLLGVVAGVLRFSPLGVLELP